MVPAHYSTSGFVPRRWVMMTASSLELYSRMPGVALAAREISKAVTAAKRQMVRDLKGVKTYLTPEDAVRSEVYAAYRKAVQAVRVVLARYSDMGAQDSEPDYHVRQALIEGLAKHYKVPTSILARDME